MHNFENRLRQAHTEEGEGDFVMSMNLSKFEASSCNLRRILIDRHMSTFFHKMGD